MIVWTPAVLSVLYACVLYFCICPCSAQLSKFHMERRSRNTLIIIIIIVVVVVVTTTTITTIIILLMLVHLLTSSLITRCSQCEVHSLLKNERTEAGILAIFDRLCLTNSRIACHTKQSQMQIPVPCSPLRLWTVQRELTEWT